MAPVKPPLWGRLLARLMLALARIPYLERWLTHEMDASKSGRSR